jgi:hypothetical protein
MGSGLSEAQKSMEHERARGMMSDDDGGECGQCEGCIPIFVNLMSPKSSLSRRQS